MKQAMMYLLAAVSALVLSACGGGGGGGSAPDSAAEPTLSFAQVKLFRFNWSDVDGATHYRLLENPDGVSGFSQVGTDIPAGTGQYDHEVPLHARVNARYILQSCNAAGCTDSSELSVSGTLAEAVGYFKAFNTGAEDRFGHALALSADGNTLAVGAPYEDSNAIGIDGDINDNSAPYSGAVYVFVRNGEGSWVRQAYVKASNTDSGDNFGWSVALSADGDTLAVGADNEDSNATGINGNQSDDSATSAGAVYVFSRSGSAWSQQAYIKASNPDSSDWFGWSVALSADGDTLAVGARYESSKASGINGDQNDNSSDSAGAVYVFSRSGSAWSQQAYVKASNTGAGDQFGYAVVLSDDGATLAVSARDERSNATGINTGDQSDDSAEYSGAVYVFGRTGNSWSQQAYVKASNTDPYDRFGVALALSADGNTLAVGADGEASNATGINGSQTNDSAPQSGAVYVFTRINGSWSQHAYIKASNTEGADFFGRAVALSADGNSLAVGAYGEDSIATGIDGNIFGNNASYAGAVWVFIRDGAGNWVQQAYVKSSNTDASDNFGKAVALSADGDTLAVGAVGEDGNATDIGGNQSDDSAAQAGAVYLY